MPTGKIFIATRPFTYGTRKLVVGDEFEPKRKDERILLATKKVREKRQTTAIDPPPAGLAEKVAAKIQQPPAKPAAAEAEAPSAAASVPPETSAETSAATVGTSGAGLVQGTAEAPRPEASDDADLAQAREAFREKFGRPPHYRWDAATIREKIAES